MRWVPTATINPHRCAVIPFVSASDPEGFIDTGSELSGFGPDKHVYVSVKAVNEMASLIGRPTISQFREVVDSNIALASKLAEVTAERDGLEERFAAIDVLASADFVARKKQGRRPTKKDETPEEVVAA
jgi:hypothetical protein